MAGRWQCGPYEFSWERPLIMGILNVTPDSFSDGGQHNEFEDALAFADQMMAQGAHIIDVGGESTRPGSDEVAVEEELRRTVDVVAALAAKNIPVSIDTRHAQVAQAALEAGACIINDVSGFRDPAMVAVLAASDAGCVIMHMLGEPKTMQAEPHYDDVVAEISTYLAGQAKMLQERGIVRQRICIDYGPGFGKTTAHNLALLEATPAFCQLGYPLMIATSRKRFIGEVYGGAQAADRAWGSVATAVRGVLGGGTVFRVHDVPETVAGFRALEEPAKRSIIALGSNMGDRLANLQQAIDGIHALPKTQVIAASPVVESEPAFYEDQDRFANAVCVVQTNLFPEVLLEELHRLENQAGRTRSFANAPRPLDLDILDYEDVVQATGNLDLPHPGILQRDFVVTPLLQCLPDVILADGTKVTGKRVEFGKVTGVLGSLEINNV